MLMQGNLWSFDINQLFLILLTKIEDMKMFTRNL